MALFAGKIALVTGAASGIGRAIALAYAKNGASVLVSDINDARDTVAAIRAQGGKAEFARADVSSAEENRELVAKAVSTFGRLDIACNNAGIAGDLAPTADYSEDTWRRVINTNLNGVFYGMKHQLRQMLAQSGGSSGAGSGSGVGGIGGYAIVNIASILGERGFANAPAYTAAKHGVVGLTRTAALEYSGRGVRINVVGPAFIKTPMITPVMKDDAATQALVSGGSLFFKKKKKK